MNDGLFKKEWLTEVQEAQSRAYTPCILFLVVWGLSDIIATFCPRTLFINVDFPTFGRPIILTKPDLNPSKSINPYPSR